MRKIKKRSFAIWIFRSTILFLLLLAGVLILLGFIFNQHFFLQYSPDKIFKESTLEKITLLRILLFISAGISIAFTILINVYKGRILSSIERNKKILQNMLLLFFTMAICLLSGEAILRVFLANETSLYGVSPGSLKFNHDHVSLNNEFFRDYNFTLEKPKNTIRIAVIGDSFTFGSGVENASDLYPKILERELNIWDSSAKYEVYNFGIPGKDIPEEINITRDYALRFNPDIVIVGFVYNDFVTADSEIKNEMQEIWALPFIGFWLRGTSYLYYFAESRANRFFENIGIKPVYENTLQERYASEFNKAFNKRLYQLYSENLTSKNISLVILAFPVFNNLEEYKFYFIHEFIAEVAVENNVPIIDLLNSYKNISTKELTVNSYDSHPNGLAHHIAGLALADFIKNNLQCSSKGVRIAKEKEDIQYTPK